LAGAAGGEAIPGGSGSQGTLEFVPEPGPFSLCLAATVLLFIARRRN
jgi:hypothetical protein